MDDTLPFYNATRLEDRATTELIGIAKGFVVQPNEILLMAFNLDDIDSKPYEKKLWLKSRQSKLSDKKN